MPHQTVVVHRHQPETILGIDQVEQSALEFHDRVRGDQRPFGDVHAATAHFHRPVATVAHGEQTHSVQSGRGRTVGRRPSADHHPAPFAGKKPVGPAVDRVGGPVVHGQPVAFEVPGFAVQSNLVLTGPVEQLARDVQLVGQHGFPVGEICQHHRHAFSRHEPFDFQVDQFRIIEQRLTVGQLVNLVSVQQFPVHVRRERFEPFGQDAKFERMIICRCCCCCDSGVVVDQWRNFVDALIICQF
ncbi:Non-reducing polyketide synthase [Trichinella spiralis]|uniref:Non-reducing polyketide synthase n=1 Tax=Trichinella spiralis TaxID=6334 RepID=A0ABR3KXQ2_TRISP